MYFCYRGNSYYRPVGQINSIVSKIINGYQGVDDCNQSKVVIDLQPNILQYRGITYLKSI
ncbi:MAG: DUF4278 domain-containing protein [Cyanobacteria bacterium P01_G01_bin.39]